MLSKEFLPSDYGGCAMSLNELSGKLHFKISKLNSIVFESNRCSSLEETSGKSKGISVGSRTVSI
jgi:hypothetical protein